VNRILAIDPGNTESAYVVIDSDTRRPVISAKAPNDDVADWISDNRWSPAYEVNRAAIEMVASYGMAVGRDVFETCVWIGRFAERAGIVPVDLVYRRDVKLHHCGSAKAKDANIAQALIDRFAPGEPNRGKGTKKAPGWFYGFHSDIWAAYSVAVYVADTAEGFQP
jgi:hypothetical protein